MTSKFRQDFGASLRLIRKSKQLNQDEVAEKAGLSTSYISDVERGVANPKLDTIDALAKGVGVPPAELFNFDGIVFSPSEIRKRIISSMNTCTDADIENIYTILLNIILHK